jgi:hypothetical protein
VTRLPMTRLADLWQLAQLLLHDLAVVVGGRNYRHPKTPLLPVEDEGLRVPRRPSFQPHEDLFRIIAAFSLSKGGIDGGQFRDPTWGDFQECERATKSLQIRGSLRRRPGRTACIAAMRAPAHGSEMQKEREEK